MNYNPLTPAERRVIEDGGTERPFAGEYDDFYEAGTYICRRCNVELYRSDDKFDAHRGWPAFDDEIPGAVLRLPDPDGQRIEIQCANCGGHLGHVFLGERLTEKNTRHCVNSLSMRFVPAPEQEEPMATETATLAGGCFWCLEAVYELLRGVQSVQSGYTGGDIPDPSYEAVCTGRTGHAEAVQVVFDPDEISFRDLLDVFFTIHDPTTLNRQGADVGTQYRSAIFTHSDEQRATAEAAIAEVTREGLWGAPIVTEITPLDVFYPAEGYHDQYYRRNPEQGYCQIVIAPKVAKARSKFFDRLRA